MNGCVLTKNASSHTSKMTPTLGTAATSSKDMIVRTMP